MKSKKISTCIKRYLFDQEYRFGVNNYVGLYRKMDDKYFIEKSYHKKFGKQLDLNNPKTFNEKLQWIKLNDHNPQYTILVDKVLARQYVAEKIGKQYLIPLIGVWDSPDDIDFNLLPNQFVLKCNHNSGLGMCICTDKSKLDKDKAKKELFRGLRQNYYLTWREWPYKNVPRKIIAEQYLEAPGNDLPDYKFHCFNGRVKLILVCRNRFGKSGMTEDFFDEDWRHLDIKRPGHENAAETIQRPEKLEEMIALAEKLSQNIPFLRVDFYYVNNRIYFGELTFFPASGFTKFVPEQWDTILGSYLQLPGRFITDN